MTIQTTNIPSGGSGLVLHPNAPSQAGPAQASPPAPVTGNLGGQTVTKAPQPATPKPPTERKVDEAVTLLTGFLKDVGDDSAAIRVCSRGKLTGELAQSFAAWAKTPTHEARLALGDAIVRTAVESPSAKKELRELSDSLYKRAIYTEVSEQAVFYPTLPKDAAHLPRSEQFKQMHEPDLTKMLGLFMRGNEKEYAKLLQMVDGYHEFLDKMPLATDARNTAKMIGQLESALKEIEQQAGKIGNAKWAAQVRYSINAEKLALQHFKALSHLHDGRLGGLGQGMSLGRAMEQALRMGASDLTTVQIASPIEVLGSGQLNTVYKATFETFAGEQFEGVIKFDPDLVRTGDIPEQIGKHAAEVIEVIGKAQSPEAPKSTRGNNSAAAWARPNMGARVMATGVLDQLLKTNVVPQTHLAVINGTPATVMELARGVSVAKKVDTVLFSESELNKLKDALAEYRKVVTETNKALGEFFKDPVLQLGSFARDIGSVKALSTALEAGHEIAIGQDSGKTLLIDESGNLMVRPKQGKDELKSAKSTPFDQTFESALSKLVGARVELQQAINVGVDRLTNPAERKMCSSPFHLGGLFTASSVEDVMSDDLKITPLGVVYSAPRPPALNYADPGLMREMMKLQALDFLSGEKDHHAGNFLIYKDEKSGYSVKAFDNDLSWVAEEASDPKGSTKYLLPNDPIYGSYSRNLGLPPALDASTCLAILVMANAPQPALEALGRHLSPQQIEAFKERLDLFAKAIQSGEVKSMREEDWKEQNHVGVKAVLKDTSRSYVARDKDTLEGLVSQGFGTTAVPWD